MHTQTHTHAQLKLMVMCHVVVTGCYVLNYENVDLVNDVEYLIVLPCSMDRFSRCNHLN